MTSLTAALLKSSYCVATYYINILDIYYTYAVYLQMLWEHSLSFTPSPTLIRVKQIGQSNSSSLCTTPFFITANISLLSHPSCDLCSLSIYIQKIYINNEMNQINCIMLFCHQHRIYESYELSELN